MTDELRAKIIGQYEYGYDVNDICWDLGAARGEVRRVISEATAKSMEDVRKRMANVRQTLYARHLECRIKYGGRKS
jgi:hypothetical protein